MGELVHDVLEQILVGLDVKDLVRYKSVCKSWKSLISDPSFAKNNLNHSYKNNKLGHTRVTMDLLVDGFKLKVGRSSHLLGSCNGLVCIGTSDNEILVANPCTGEVKNLTQNCCMKSLTESYCCGFGYDKSSDDYKVVAGFSTGEDRTSFYVLKLKSNVWKFIGEVKYSSLNRAGILRNGALHWVDNIRIAILSFDLSNEAFKETIPHPFSYIFLAQCIANDTLKDLGIIEECLCILLTPIKSIWILKDQYNSTPSLARLGQSQTCNLQCEALSFFKLPENSEQSLDRGYLLKYVGAPIFVESLVSPHTHPSDTRL